MHISSENKKKPVKVETKNILCFGTRNDLKQPTTSWNDLNGLQGARNDLKVKRPTTTWLQSEQETTWNALQRARNNLKRPTTSKKWPETTYNEQETTWNNIQRARNDLKWPTTTWKDLQRTRNDLETTRNEQKTTWNNPQQVRQPTTTRTYSKRAKKRRGTTNNQIYRLFYNMGQSVLFSNTFSMCAITFAIIRALLHEESGLK